MKFASFILLIIFCSVNISALTFAKNNLSPNISNIAGIQFKGIIIDEDSKLPLPYVNLGIINKPVGTVSDEKGEFSLNIGSDLEKDILQISLIGYYSHKIAVKDLLKSKEPFFTINLRKSNLELNEVMVTAKKLNEKIIGRSTTGGMFEATFNKNKNEISAKLGTEIGLKIKSPNYPAILKDFNWYFSGNNFDKIKFRINLYSLKNNLPDTLLLNKEIYVEVNNAKTGWNNVNLESYNLTVASDFVIALQWVDHKFTSNQNPAIWIPGTLSALHLSYLRDGSQDKWQKFKGNLSYYVTLLY